MSEKPELNCSIEKRELNGRRTGLADVQMMGRMIGQKGELQIIINEM